APSLRAFLERTEELLGGIEGLDTSGGEVGFGFPLTGLPFGRPVPGLRRIDDLLRAQKDAFVRDFGVQKVALLEVGSLPDRLRQCQLPFRAKRRSCHLIIVTSESQTVYPFASSFRSAFVRARDAERSSPTGNGAAHTSVAPAAKRASICVPTASSAPTIAASAGPATRPFARTRW